MTETTTQNPPNSKERWYAAPYHDLTRPSLAFRLTAGLLIIGWIVLTGWIVTKTQTVGSPDEAANRLFIQHLAQTGSYRLSEGLTAAMVSFVHPRSIAVVGQDLASGSFLGLIQAGALIAKLFGLGAERFLIPLLMLGALLAMYDVFRRFWGRWWSLLGVVLLALHPALFEFATLPYMHNGAFVAGLMIAGWALLRLLERPRFWFAVVSGAAFGLALFFRPVEVLWTAPAIIIVLLARKLWRELIVVGVVTLFVQMPWLLANHAIYGSFLSSGYTPSGVFTDSVNAVASVAAPAKTLFTPPGGWSWHWLSSTWWYFILLLPTWSLMGLIAISRYFRRKYVTWSKSFKLSVMSLIAIFPLVYYGCWNLYPTTPSGDVGALASYARYWLSLYVMLVPGVIITLRLFTRRWLVVVVAAVMLFSQGWTIWQHPVSGLQARFSADQLHQITRQNILRVTEPGSVVIAGAADKYIQGDRLALFQLPTNVAEWQALRTLVQQRPVYVYEPVGTPDASVMNSYGLTVTIQQAFDKDSVWKITPL